MSIEGTVSVNDDLDVAWAKVVQDFETEARFKPADKRRLTIDDVLAGINPKDVTPDTKDKAKVVVQNVLVSIQRFGDFVASATSVVFGPSQQCFNALNFVIVATQTYSKVFEDLTTLLERVSVFLETLRIYLDENGADAKLDKRLRPNVYRVLQHFMAILTLTTRLTTRSGKAKLFAKALFFGEDGGVTEALATLETRVSDVVRIQVAVIGRDLSEAARNIRAMKGDMDLMLEYDRSNAGTLDRLEQGETLKKLDDTIRFWLALHHLDLWRIQHARVAEERVSGTGSWLATHHQEFARWCDPAATAPPVVLVTGEPGCGKTFLASAVIEHLRDTVQLGSNATRATIAYDYVQKNALQGSSLTPLNGALRSVVWQLAKSDSDYYRFVADACKKGDGIDNAEQVWESLIASYKPTSAFTFFIVVDGLSDKVAETLRTIVQQLPHPNNGQNTNRLQIRLFVTAASGPVYSNITADRVYNVSLDPGLDHEKLVANINDVRSVIKERLSQMPIFCENTSLLKRQQQQRVLDLLSRHIQNDFARLELVLRELEHCVNLRQLEEILEQVHEPIQAKIGRQVNIMNQSLSQDEVLEVNAIISCIETFSFREPELDVLLIEQYVDLALNATRLVPLRHQIEQKYHNLFMVDTTGLVSWRYDGMRAFLVEAFEDDKIINAINAKRGKSPLGLDLEELDLLEKVVQTNFANVFGLHGSGLFDKYGFAEFFASKRGHHKTFIRLNEQQSRVFGLCLCLKAICEESAPSQVDHLCAITREEFHNLMQRAEVDCATPEQSRLIGASLTKFLRNDACIDRWSQDTTWSESMRKWYLRCECPSDWLVIPGLVDEIRDSREQEWLRGRKDDFWGYVTDRLVGRWIKHGNTEWVNASCFIPSRRIDEIQDWLFKRYPDIDQRLVTKLLIEGFCGGLYNETYRQRTWVVEVCKTILKTEPNNWWALSFSAQVLAHGLSNVNEAYKYLQIATSLPPPEDEENITLYWTDMMPLMGYCQTRLQDTISANNTYIRIMEHGTRHRRGMLEMRAFATFEPELIVEALVTARRSLVPGANTWNWFDELAITVLDHEGAYALKAAAHHDSSWSVIIGLMESIILKITARLESPDHFEQDSSPGEAQTSAQWYQTLKELNSTMAYILWYESDDNNSRDRALDIWLRSSNCQPLIEALLSQAKAEVPNSPLTAPAFHKLTELVPEICSEEVSTLVPFSSRLVVARWQYLAGDVAGARSIISTLLAKQEYTTGCTSNRIGATFCDWTLACSALHEDHMVQVLYRQAYQNKGRIHDGCEQVCQMQPENEKYPILICRDCMQLIYTCCYQALEKGLWTPQFCSIDHDHLAIQDSDEYGPSPMVEKRGLNGENYMEYKPDYGVYDRARVALGLPEASIDSTSM